MRYPQNFTKSNLELFEIVGLRTSFLTALFLFLLAVAQKLNHSSTTNIYSHSTITIKFRFTRTVVILTKKIPPYHQLPPYWPSWPGTGRFAMLLNVGEVRPSTNSNLISGNGALNNCIILYDLNVHNPIQYKCSTYKTVLGERTISHYAWVLEYFVKFTICIFWNYFLAVFQAFLRKHMKCYCFLGLKISV